LALAGIFDDPDSPGDVSARHDDYIREAFEEEAVLASGEGLL
jgi:hypothetical protein